MMNSRSVYVTGIFLFGLMQGCTMVQTYPMAARPGDTITIALGSIDGATTKNLTVQYYSASNPSVPIDLSSNIRSVFNITPDRTSPAWTSTIADLVSTASGHGPWQSVVALDLPTSGIPEGPGNIRVTLGAGASVPDGATSPNGLDIALEILHGTGAANPFKYRPLSDTSDNLGELNLLMPGTQYVVKPAKDPGEENFVGINYAAAEYILFMPIRNKANGLPPTELTDSLRVVLDPHPANDANQVNLNWRRDGDNIVVYVTSPNNQMFDRQTRFSVVISDDATFTFSGAASITGVSYFDINGHVVATTPLPLLQGINL